MEKSSIVAALLTLGLAATIPVAVYGQQLPVGGPFSKYGTPVHLKDSVYGIEIWDFNIREISRNDTDRQIAFSLTMAADVPVFPVVQVIDKDGYTRKVSFPQFSMSLGEAKRLEDLIATSGPMTVPHPKSFDEMNRDRPENMQMGSAGLDIYTINIMLFKDAEHKVMFENVGYLVTMMMVGELGGGNCYQYEYACLQFSGLRNDYDRGVRAEPWGWKYNKDDSARPMWAYQNSDKALSVKHRTDVESGQPVEHSPEFRLAGIPNTLTFGQTINATLTGPFAVATAMLYHIDADGKVHLVSVDQAGPNDPQLEFPIPAGPQDRYQPGDYRLEITVTDQEGNRFPYIYRWTL